MACLSFVQKAEGGYFFGRWALSQSYLIAQASQELTLQSRLAENSWSSCSSTLCVGITGIYHYSQLVFNTEHTCSKEAPARVSSQDYHHAQLISLLPSISVQVLRFWDSFSSGKKRHKVPHTLSLCYHDKNLSLVSRNDTLQ